MVYDFEKDGTIGNSLNYAVQEPFLYCKYIRQEKSSENWELLFTGLPVNSNNWE